MTCTTDEDEWSLEGRDSERGILFNVMEEYVVLSMRSLISRSTCLF